MKKQSSGFFTLLVCLLVIPLFLHRKWRVARRIIIPAVPAQIFPFLNDVKNWPLWMEWARRGDMQISSGEVTSGIGAEQRWSVCRMSGTARIFNSMQDDHVAYEVRLDRCDCKLEAVLALEPIGNKTRVTWLCTWDSGPNPFMRYADLFSKIILKRDFDAGLENLKNLASNRPQE